MAEDRLSKELGYKPQRIAVFRALVIGDMLCAVPAFRALRSAYPDAHIALVGLPWAREFVDRYHAYFDEFIEFPGFPGLPEREFASAEFPQFLQALHARRFDVVLQMHGSGSFVNSLCELMGARLTAGFYLPGDLVPNGQTYLQYPTDCPEVWRHLRLLDYLGIAPCGDTLELPLTTADYTAFAQLRVVLDLGDEPYICLHPGARFPSRRWHAARYAELGDRLSRQGYRIVITGTHAERQIAAAVEQQMQTPAINLAGLTNFGALAVLLSQARLLISNDTGVSHIAAAVRVPSVVIVTGSDPLRWAPLDAARHQTVMGAVDCRPCEHVICPIGFGCADAVSVDAVLTRALAMLDTYAPIPTPTS